MIVFDLKCSHNHVFEAWFGSSADYESQRERSLIACPICGDGDIGKAVMAPAVSGKSNQRETLPVPVRNERRTTPDAARLREALARMAQAQQEALKTSEWVGRSFAENARAMHYGEKAHKSIHGEVAPEEARSLIDEGVEVAPLLFPVIPPDQAN